VTASHPIREAIVRLLQRDGRSSASKMSREIDATLRAVSYHVAVLRVSG
jgi:DNA-binding transcriptional ArsR family regulator